MVLGFKRKYLKEDTLIGLKNYKYKGGPYSFFDDFFQPFWNGLVELLPIWMAPNLVTLVGTLAEAVAVICLLQIDTTFTV